MLFFYGFLLLLANRPSLSWHGLYNQGIERKGQMKDQCYQFLKNEVGKVEIVGFGSYGEVKLARNTENDSVVAIKMIYNKNAKEEIDVHHKLNHPNIIKLLNYYYEKDKNMTYMVLEYASGGSLNEKIKFGYGQLSKALIRRYFRDICEAVKYLHENNFMHRDIKTENILITDDNHAKLCDFGFASILEYRSTLCGTFEYMAPEMIQKKPYDYKIDIWALGILLFELIQGYAPFRGDTGEEVIAEMKKSLIFSSRFDQLEIDLIKKILRVNAENRPEISKILEHPYFKIEDKEIGIKEKPSKNIAELKEESGKETKEKKESPEIKKKEGEKKFDFFHRKGEKVDPKKQSEEEKNQKKKEAFKQFPKQQPKKEEPRRQFKPYVPANLQNPPRNLIKSPNYKPQTSFTPLSPSGFPQQHLHQFNASMQLPQNYHQGSFPTHSQNANISLTTASTKYFQPHSTGPVLPPSSNPLPTFSSPNLSKFSGQGYNIEQRVPTHMPQSYGSWKKP